MSKVIFIALSSVFFSYESVAMYVDDISETYGIHKRHLSSTDDTDLEKDTDYQQKEKLSYEEENFILGMKEFRSHNFKKSFDYIKKAALCEHADAEYTLGLFYEFALDQQRNFKEAEYWYSKSGTDGNEKAKESIKRVNEKKNSWFYNWY